MASNDPNEIFGDMYGAIASDGDMALEALGLPKDAAILDVGTGEGKFAIYLAAQGYRVLTGEPSTDSSHYAGKDWALNAEKAGVRDRIRFQAFDASDMPFDPESFDAVFFFGVLHHVEERLRSAVLQEALRVAKASGAVVFFEPNRQTLETIWTEDPGHPLAANPADYLADRSVRERRFEGAMMDIVLYRKAA